jgi:hypothetical protein
MKTSIENGSNGLTLDLLVFVSVTLLVGRSLTDTNNPADPLGFEVCLVD